MLFPTLALLMVAAGINGSWVAQRPGPGGQTTDTQFNFTQEGNAFTGTMLSTMGSQKIVNGKIDGDTITFEVIANMMGQERRMTYQGKLEGDTLKLTMQMPAGAGPGGPGGPPPGAGPGGPGGPGGGMRGPREMVARRGVSESLQKQMEADARRPKPTLPERKALAPNGLAQTPPMGWNSWNKFATRVSDQLIRETADALASSGMRDAGYVYLTIDDGWQGTRDDAGNLRPNERFPDMKALAGYVHAKGLKFGIYSSPGPRTCGRFEGSYGYEARDAAMFASWGVDFLKYDLCSAGQLFAEADQPRLFQLMAEHLRATGRPIVYSISQYGRASVQDWAAAIGANMWRTTFDIRDQWASVAQIGFAQNGLEKAAGPGHWNDPDMLEIGNGGLSADESRSHMALWAMLAAPLMAGNDVRSMTKETLEILTNREVLAVSQDPLGRQGYRLAQEGEAETWVKPLKDGAFAVALFNRSTAPVELKLSWSALSLKKAPRVRDLWLGRDLPAPAGGLAATAPSHGVLLWKVTP